MDRSKDVFAWSYEEMIGLNTDIVAHLLLQPEHKPVKQKLRRMEPEWNLKREEIVKQLDAGFFEVTDY